MCGFYVIVAVVVTVVVMFAVAAWCDRDGGVY